MPEITDQDLSSVAETLLIPLYVRAMESQRPDAMMKDEKAVALVTRLGEGQTVCVLGWQNYAFLLGVLKAFLSRSRAL